MGWCCQSLNDVIKKDNLADELKNGLYRGQNRKSNQDCKNPGER